MTESNLNLLPLEVAEYAKLQYEKKSLTGRVTEINRRLKAINPSIIEIMTQKELDVFELFPSKEEEVIFGGIGAVQLKMKNDYERMNKDNLILYTIQFFKYLMPEEKDENISRLGMGVGNWIWANRGRQPKHYIERVYVDGKNLDKVKKRKNPEEKSNDSTPPTKKSRTKLGADAVNTSNIPTTREEFLAISSFHKLITENPDTAPVSSES